MSNFDLLKLSVEAAHPNNTVLYDDKGLPSIMVRIPKFKISDVISGGTSDIHPAFIVDGVEKDEIYISKYQNIVYNDRAYSLAMQDPKASITFDQAKTYCENKGSGWHLMSNAEWAAIALWCKQNGFMPRGNNNYGCDHSYSHEKGVETYYDTSKSKTGRVATGSGPVSWAHDGTNAGIFDLNGNVTEWVSGLRLYGGEIQVIANNNAATGCSHAADSTLWKAILSDGSLVDPGTANTLKYDYVSTAASGGAIQLVTNLVNQQTSSSFSGNRTFQTLPCESGLTAPQLLQALALAPIDSDHGSDNIYINNTADYETLPTRGGNWSTGSGAGVFCVYLYATRSLSSTNRGFRSAYVAL